jgi:hypothetical protein
MRVLEKFWKINYRRGVNLPLVFLALLIFSGCEGPSSADHERLLKWSQSSEVQFRKKAATYIIQRNGEAWAVSTAELTVSGAAFVYSGGKVLSSGFVVYPGRIEASSIQEAMRVCSRTKGAVFTQHAPAIEP